MKIRFLKDGYRVRKDEEVETNSQAMVDYLVSEGTVEVIVEGETTPATDGDKNVNMTEDEVKKANGKVNAHSAAESKKSAKEQKEDKK